MQKIIRCVRRPPCCQPRLLLSPCRAWRARNREAPAAASAMTKSRYPVHERRLGRLNPQSRHDAATPRSHAVRRERAAAAAMVAAISMEHGFLPASARPAAPPPTRWSLPAAGWWDNTAPLKSVRMAPRPESEPLGAYLVQIRPFFGPQRLRYAGIRWMCRKLDRIKTVVANERLLAMSQAVGIFSACSLATNAETDSANS